MFIWIFTQECVVVWPSPQTLSEILPERLWSLVNFFLRSEKPWKTGLLLLLNYLVNGLEIQIMTNKWIMYEIMHCWPHMPRRSWWGTSGFLLENSCKNSLRSCTNLLWRTWIILMKHWQVILHCWIDLIVLVSTDGSVVMKSNHSQVYLILLCGLASSMYSP